MMNEVAAIKVDGIVVGAAYSNAWDDPFLDITVPLPDLEPGIHRFELVVRSALVWEENLLGLSKSAPSTDWPKPLAAWTRTVRAEFGIFGADEVLVSLTEDPALDPVAAGALSIGGILVQADGAGVAVVMDFNAEGLPLPVSFEVTMRAGEREIPCGRFWVAPDPDGRRVTSSGLEMRVNLDRLDPELREATLVLTPEPNAIERMGSVDRIWGGQVVFPDVPLKRLDLERSNSAASGQ